MIKGLVLFDYDGTLVDEREAIYVPTNQTKRAINQLQNDGYLCVLATGRALSYIPNGAKDLHLDGYVTCNGAYVTIHGKVIQEEVFEEEELDRLIQYMDEADINYILEGNAFCYVKDLDEQSYLHFMDNFKVPKDKFVQYKNLDQIRDKICKLTLLYKNREALHIAQEKLNSVYQISIHRNCNSFDIGKKTMNKGVGTNVIMERFQIAYENTYAFGDGDNDVELLDTACYGIAMKEHNSQLDAVAYMVTSSVKEEGIFEALRKLEVI